MKNKKKNTGFTLIEMLVVVLIMGILASIGIPQYQKAVNKARFTEAVTLANTIKKAEEMYYLAHREYTTDLGELDIKLKFSPAGTAGEYDLSDGKCRAILTDVNRTDNLKNMLVRCRLGANNTNRVGVFMFMDNATLGGEPIQRSQRRSCIAYSDNGSTAAQQVCESVGGPSTTLPTGEEAWPM